MNLNQINEQNKYNKFSTRFYSDCQTKRVDFFQPTFKELGDKNENLHQQPGIISIPITLNTFSILYTFSNKNTCV